MLFKIFDFDISKIWAGVPPIWIVVIFLSLFCGFYYLNDTECRAQWKNSSFQSRYSIVNGCQIKTQDGLWIQAPNYKPAS